MLEVDGLKREVVDAVIGEKKKLIWEQRARGDPGQCLPLDLGGMSAVDGSSARLAGSFVWGRAASSLPPRTLWLDLDGVEMWARL